MALNDLIQRFSALRRQCTEARKDGTLNSTMIRERNDALEAALVGLRKHQQEVISLGGAYPMPLVQRTEQLARTLVEWRKKEMSLDEEAFFKEYEGQFSE